MITLETDCTLETHWQECRSCTQIPAGFEAAARRIFFLGAMSALRVIVMRDNFDFEAVMDEIDDCFAEDSRAA